jgi:hypothetical protein
MTDNSNLNPHQRTLRVRLAAHTHQRNAETTHVRAERIERISKDRFADQADPHHELSPEERAQRARSARRAYYTALAFRSSRARSRRHGAADQ